METGLEAVMADRSTVETLAQALAQFETIGMPARNLATRTRREYSRDLCELLSYLEQCGTTRLSGEPAKARRIWYASVHVPYHTH